METKYLHEQAWFNEKWDGLHTDELEEYEAVLLSQIVEETKGNPYLYHLVVHYGRVMNALGYIDG